jgi:AraC-like DNA-binding protein
MKIYVKFDFNFTCKAILSEQLDKLGVPYQTNGTSDISIQGSLSPAQYKELVKNLAKYGIHIIDDQKMELVERIKDSITEMLADDTIQLYKISSYLADKLNYSYSYLSNLFSEATYTSIENFIILKKVDRAKELMAETNLTLTEIAFRLNYSSVAHLSGQFKKTTGLTPSAYHRILKKRKKRHLNTNN